MPVTLVCAPVDGCPWQHVLFRETDLFWRGPPDPCDMCREYKRIRRTRSRGSRDRNAQGRRRERERKRKKTRMKGVFVRQGRNIYKSVTEISTCVFHSRSSLDPLCASASSSFVEEVLSSASHRLYPVTVEPTVSSLDTVTLPRLTSSEARPPSSGYSFVRYFSSGTLARQSYSPVSLSPTRTVSFNLVHVI